MIIKKKKLNKVLGNVPEDTQSEDMIAEDDVMQNDENFSSEDEFSQQYDENDEYSQPLDDSDYDGTIELSQPQRELQPRGSQDLNSQSSEEDDDDLFSLDNIDFKQRQERRKGDRRRGFRRVDDRNLISRAREEADAIRENAVQEGYQAGLDQAEATLQEIRESIAAFMNAKQEVFEMLAPHVLEISVDIAEKIIKKEVAEDSQILINTAVDVMKNLSKDENKILLRVNPAQVDVVKQQVPEILSLSGLDAKVSVLADEGVMEGGCLLTTSNGVVDATIETQFAVVCEALRGV